MGKLLVAQLVSTAVEEAVNVFEPSDLAGVRHNSLLVPAQQHFEPAEPSRYQSRQYPN